jgi:hypothetical protein
MNQRMTCSSLAPISWAMQADFIGRNFRYLAAQ